MQTVNATEAHPENKKYDLAQEDFKAAVLKFFDEHGLKFHPYDSPLSDNSFTAYGICEETPETGWAIRLTASPARYGGIDFDAAVTMNYLGDEWQWAQILIHPRLKNFSSTLRWTTADIAEYYCVRTSPDPEYLVAIRHTFETESKRLKKKQDDEKIAKVLGERFGADDKGEFSGKGYMGRAFVGFEGPMVKFEAVVTDPEKIAAIKAILDAG